MALRYEGWTVSTATDGAAAIAVGAQRAARCRGARRDVARHERARRTAQAARPDTRLPLLLLTAKDAVEDRIAGLTAGGDDYVTKPFSLEEVVLRLRALLRRTGVTAETQWLDHRRRRPSCSMKTATK